MSQVPPFPTIHLDGADDMTATITPETTPEITPVIDTTATDSATRDPRHEVTRRRLLSAEWFKFRTVRSNLFTLLGALGAAIGLGVLFSTLTEFDGPAFRPADSLSLSLAGFDLAQMIIAILGVARCQFAEPCQQFAALPRPQRAGIGDRVRGSSQQVAQAQGLAHGFWEKRQREVKRARDPLQNIATQRLLLGTVHRRLCHASAARLTWISPPHQR